jgi:hypothetical protein
MSTASPAVSGRARGFFSQPNNGIAPTRRLARSAHLHTIEADRVLPGQRLKSDTALPNERTPTRSVPRLPYVEGDDSGIRLLPPTFSEVNTPSRSPDLMSSSGYEDETGASASEAESEMIDGGPWRGVDGVENRTAFDHHDNKLEDSR